jgi:hypothetical protein
MTEALPSAPLTAEDCVALARVVAPHDGTAGILALAVRVHEAATRPPAMTPPQLGRFAESLRGTPEETA